MTKYKWTIIYVLAASVAAFLIGRLMPLALSFMFGVTLGSLASLCGLERDTR